MQTVLHYTASHLHSAHDVGRSPKRFCVHTLHTSPVYTCALINRAPSRQPIHEPVCCLNRPSIFYRKCHSCTRLTSTRVATPTSPADEMHNSTQTGTSCSNGECRNVQALNGKSARVSSGGHVAHSTRHPIVAADQCGGHNHCCRSCREIFLEKQHIFIRIPLPFRLINTLIHFFFSRIHYVSAHLSQPAVPFHPYRRRSLTSS